MRCKKKQCNYAEKVYYISCINHAPADALIMKVYTCHGNIIISAAAYNGKFADGIETIV